ncbi:MAG: hypothetical protein AAGK32_11485 [Actinomycetota bacterium]
MAKHLGAALVAILLAASCGGDDGGDDADSAATTAGNEATTTTEAGACAAETSLQVVNAQSASGFSGDDVDLDGSFDVVTEFADASGEGGAGLVFADYEIPEDPQFGLSAPVGDPEAPEGGLFFNVSITTGGEGAIDVGEYRALEPGEGAISSPGDITDPDASIPDVPPSVNFESMYLGPERILIGEHSVTLTEVTETQLCGEITGDAGQSDLQADGFPVVEGTFVVDRI